ncbi:MAG: SH3 domain-containing protein, partial [Planctomycetota bacterium]|nr:SH3 domain-containing protein [Planctomycetota bacterium]
LLFAGTARAGDEPARPVPAPTPEEERAEPREPEPVVALVKGNRVNLRVGPRVDIHPVRRMDEGTVLLIVERVPGWYGVRVPEGFPAALASRFTRPVGSEAVRIEASRLNVRVRPPEPGGPMPGAFRDHPARGEVVPVVERVGDWVRIWAPETIRAYVSADYVKELGPLSEHMAVVAAARDRRAARLQALAEERRRAAALKSGAALREAMGTAQQKLYKLRMARGIERTPVVMAINALERVMEEAREAPVSVRKLANAIRADLEAELEMRMARKDAEVARLRGLTPPAEKPPAPKIARVEVRGVIRWEAAPRWRNGGAYVLWIGEDPRYVLHVTTGLPHPLPDLKRNADGREHTIRGEQSGDRVFGLPVIEVTSITN